MAVAIAFWIFIAVVSVAGMVQDYRKRQLALEPLRIAIEHGQQHAISQTRLLPDHQQRVGLGHAALGERVLDRRHRHGV